MDYFDQIVGQSRAIAILRASLASPVHAYLFVGPAGSQKHACAKAFAATLLDDKRAFDGVHPDVIEIEREGASISVEQAREISRVAARSPSEGARKVLILEDFHLVDEAAPALLKTIEEASETTIFVIMAERVTPMLVTIASRCVRVDFSRLSDASVREVLVAEGVDPIRASDIATSAMGNVDRARLLVNDAGAVARHQLWLSLTSRLDGRGTTRTTIGDEIVAALDAALDSLNAQHESELASQKAHVKEGLATQGSLKTVEAMQKREVRRFRTDELRVGFATLAQEFARRLQLAPDENEISVVEHALEALRWANRSLVFNPNEALLLQGLLAKLDDVKLRTS